MYHKVLRDIINKNKLRFKLKVGYARVSSNSQNLYSQIELLKNVGCEKIFKEKKSASQNSKREVLDEALDFVREGDVFVVTRLDRCSRSVLGLYKIIEKLNKKGVDFKATEQEIDTSTSSGRLMIGLLSIVAEFETDLRKERQSDGIASALKRGVKFGRKAKFDTQKTLKAIDMQKNGFTNQEIADNFKIARSTLLRWISEHKKSRK